MRKRLINLLAYLFFCAACLAQQYPFVHYTPKDGLVNSRVRKALQDSKGRMYFLTYSGLSIYDGTRFKNYTTESGLHSNLLNDMLEVGPDSFLVATNTSGLNVLVRGQIKNLEVGLIPIVNEFLKDNKGVIYASTDDGLYKLVPGRLEKMADERPGGGKPVMYLGNMAEYRDWLVFTTNDLRHYEGLFLYNKLSNKIVDFIPNVLVHDLKLGPDGNIWVAENTLMILDSAALSAGKLVLKKSPVTSHNGVSPLPINILFNKQKEPLLFSGNDGIFFYNKDGTQLHVESPAPGQPVVQSAFLDREDVLWVCYDGNGIYKLANTKFNSTRTLFGINTLDFQNIISFGDTTLFVPFNGQWVLFANNQHKLVPTNLPPGSLPVRFTKKYVYAVDLHRLYLAPNTPQGPLVFKPIMHLRDTSGFGGGSIEDPYGNIFVYERNNIFVINHDKIIGSLPVGNYDMVQGMFMRGNNEFWIITRSTSLRIYSLHPEDTAGYFRMEMEFVKEFENSSPRSTLIDKKGILWVGTRNHGLFAFTFTNKQLQKLHHFQVHNGLTDNFVTALACDGNDNIIVGTQTGLDRLIRSNDGSYRIENITRSNNIFSYIISVWTDKSNNAYALTNAKTLLQVKSVEPAGSLTEPHLLLEEMKVNGELLPTSDDQRLTYLQRNISFHIASPTFIDEQQVQYSYRLKGSGNNEWSDPGNNADIVLLNLTPGKYTLEVIASFPSTSYAPKQLAYSFEILPPWWETWWFRLAMGSLVILAAMYAIRFYYRRKLEKQMTVLEKQQAIEKERTRIATDMHDDLGAGLSRIKFLSETIGIKKQKQLPIEEDISSIRQYSHEMIDKMGEIVWALNERNDSLSDLLSYTRAYAVEYLSQNGIQCIVNAPDYFPVTFVSGEYRRNIYLSVKEALHNIVKHANAGQVVINVEMNHLLAISIADDGAGFSTNDVQPYSNGLSNMKKRMTDIGGSLEISHEKGTTIRLRAPMP